MLVTWVAVMALHVCASAQGGAKLLVDHMDDRSFVKNEGQFDNRLPFAPIRFGFEGVGQQVFLADSKIFFNLYRAQLKEKTEEEEAREQKEKREQLRKHGGVLPDAYTALEARESRVDYTTDLLEAEWVGASAAVELVSSDMDEATHTYEWGTMRNLQSKAGIRSFRKITYKNLYPLIDVEYILHPESGVKYSIILHPGADLSQVKLRYSKNPRLNPDGSITTATRFGDVTDHAPVSFYQHASEGIASSYVVHGRDITFQLGAYDNTKTVVIDPWTDLPNDVSTNWDCAWECETDAAGNSYAIFGAMPMRLRKYNAAGAIQWTYNTTYDTTAWLGTFVTDDLGNSYVTNGSVAALRKVSTAGALTWSVGNITGQLLGEFWNIAFNCDQTRLITGGTGGGFSPEPFIYEINMTNGALISSIPVHLGTGLFSPSEVRAITASENAKYYWLSHDSIGFISQSFSACPNPGSTLKRFNDYDLSYKCENWRYDNTGIEAIAYYAGFVYVNRGNRIDKRNAATLAIVATAPIPGGGFVSGFGGSYVENSGIIIDNLGRIFVGSKGSVSQFNTNLALLGTYPVTGGYNVYDVDLTSTGEVIACGSSGTSATASRVGTVESLGVLGAGPYAMPCCDASICAAGPLCDNGAPITLQSAVSGGTWSSSAPGFNPSTGVFSPSVAGVGTYTFYNTVLCGMDSIVINVILCAGMSVCRELNGNLTVTGGVPVYTWQTGTMVTSCPFGVGPGCAAFTQALNTLTWTNYTTGTTITPPPGADTVRVLDISLTFTSWNIATLPPCGPLPAELLLFEGWTRDATSNALVWVTATEENVHHYTLQSSADGINFQYLATIPAQGNASSQSTYNMVDHKAYSPITYYRLSAMDANGSYHDLSTIAVRSAQDNDFILEVFPIPATDQIHFTYTGPTSTQAELRASVFNSLGALVAEQSWPSTTHNTELSMELEGLAAGIYELRFALGAKTADWKILILGE